MTQEAERKIAAIFDENGEYPIVENEILPEKMICPQCGGITYAVLDVCHLCGEVLTE